NTATAAAQPSAATTPARRHRPRARFAIANQCKPRTLPARTCSPMAEPGATSSIEDQIRLREQKADALRQKGAHPYGNGVQVPHTTGFVKARHATDDAAALDASPTEAYGIAGRIVALRS